VAMPGNGMLRSGERGRLGVGEASGSNNAVCLPVPRLAIVVSGGIGVKVREPDRSDPTEGCSPTETPEDRPEFLASWTFRRRRELLSIRREALPGRGLRLVVVENGRVREFTFASLERLVPFQSHMEGTLLDAGWSLAEFAPDRREGRERRERRETARTTADRRRRWTTVHRH
jgi:hypothetical protein